MKKEKLSKEALSKIRSIAGSRVTPKKSEAVRRNLALANAKKNEIFKRYRDEVSSD